MGKSNTERDVGEHPQSFDSAIRTALRRGLEERSGTEGARRRVMGKGHRRRSLWGAGIPGLFGKVRKREVYAFCQQLAVLLECGMPLVRALNTLAQRTHNPALARAIMDIGARVEEGSTFSDAAARHPRLFPGLVTNVFRAGELSGNLVEPLHRAAEHGEQLTLQTHRAYAALIYPAILIVVAILVITFAFSFTIAQLRPLLDAYEVGTPLPMQAMMDLGEAFATVSFWATAVLVIVGIVVLYRVACLFRVIRLLRDRLKVRVPFVRYYVKQKLVANFARVFSTLYRSGVPLLETLQATRDTTQNELMKLSLGRVMDAVHEGEPISAPLEQANVFPFLAYDLIAVGEEAGQLDRVTTRLADYYEEKLRVDMEMLSKVVQPAIIILLAVLVGLIALSLISMYAGIVEGIR